MSITITLPNANNRDSLPVASSQNRITRSSTQARVATFQHLDSQLRNTSAAELDYEAHILQRSQDITDRERIQQEL